MRRFERYDLPEVNQWNATRGDPEFPIDVLPQVGFIEPGIACGFLYKTDSNVALLENFVSAPYSLPKERNDAIEAITDALIDAAKAASCRYVVAICRNSAIEKRAARRGFQRCGSFNLMSREV